MSDKNKDNILNNQDGFVLVLAMLIMVVLIIIGVSSINTSRVELEIAGNEKFHQQTFYEAESGLSMAMEAIRLNFDDNSTGFTANVTPDDFGDDVFVLSPGDNVTAVTLNLWQNNTAVTCPLNPSTRDLYFPLNYGAANPLDNTPPHTNIYVTGRTVYGAGSAIQMAAGYEGVGKGSGSDAHKIYDIYSQRFGNRESESDVHVEWRFVP